MKKYFYLHLLTLLAVSSANAALPAFFCSVSEIKDVIESVAVTEALVTTGRIKSIIRNENGYVISSGNCTLNVKIDYLDAPPNSTGPECPDFNLHVEPVKCSK